MTFASATAPMREETIQHTSATTYGVTCNSPARESKSFLHA